MKTPLREPAPAVARPLLVVLLPLLLLGVAAAAALPVAATEPLRYFPPGKFPTKFGSLHRMPELQCWGDANPASPRFASLNLEPFSRGARTCAAPLVDVGEVVAANASTPPGVRRTDWLIAKRPSLSWLVRWLATRTHHDRFAHTAWRVPPQWSSHGRSFGDFAAATGQRLEWKDRYRAQLFGLMTLQRNTVSGEVHRVSAKYEVVAVTAVTRAVCLLSDCSDLTAVDTTSRGACSASACNDTSSACRVSKEDAVTVVTHPPAATGGARLPVSAVQRSFLGLGRGAMVQRGWLPIPTWNLTARLLTWLHLYPGRAPEELADKTKAACESAWILNGGAAPTAAGAPNASDWLAKVAFVLCQEPVPTYLDKKTLCKGVHQQKSADETVRYNGEKFRAPGDDMKRAVVGWHVIPARGEATHAPPCTDPGALNNFSATTPADWPWLTEPPWLAGTASREINGHGSPDEVGLARRLGRCTVPVKPNANVLRLIKDESIHRHAYIDTVVDKLTSGNYLGADAPEDAFHRSDVVVTGLLVALTAAGAVTFVPKDAKRQSLGDLALFAVTVMVGFGSVAAFGLLYWKERKGARWISNATYKRLHVEFSNTTWQCRGLPDECTLPNADVAQGGLEGTSVKLSETLAVVTANGYRPLLVLLLACGAATVYSIIVAAALSAQLARERSRKGTSGTGGAATAAVTGGRVTSRLQELLADVAVAVLPLSWTDGSDASLPPPPTTPLPAHTERQLGRPPRSAPPAVLVGRASTDCGLPSPAPSTAAALARAQTDHPTRASTARTRSPVPSPVLSTTPVLVRAQTDRSGWWSGASIRSRPPSPPPPKP